MGENRAGTVLSAARKNLSDKVGFWPNRVEPRRSFFRPYAAEAFFIWQAEIRIREVSNAKKQEDHGKKIVALAKNRGFVFPGSEIYGGLANTWDYGRWVWNLKIMSSRPGGANLSPNAAIM